MALFSKKKSAIDEAADKAELFFDESFRGELRTRGRLYFEKVINENAALFKEDLDATIAHVYIDLKDHLTKQLDQQFADYAKTMKQAQDQAMSQLNDSVQNLQKQHEALGEELKKSIEYQEAMLGNVFDKSKTQIETMNHTQEEALKSLTDALQSLQHQRDTLGETLDKVVAAEKDTLTKAYQDNAALIIEHYLLGALGDQYDMKAQLPAIIKQMEENKQTIVDDIKL
jgi:DNA anti-recombination protein RmuC